MLEAAHTTWMQTYDEQVADFVVRTQPVRTNVDYQQEEARVATFRRALPGLEDLEARSSTLLALLADYATRAPQTAQVVRAATSTDPKPEVAVMLEKVGAEIDASLHEAQVAYEVASTQVKNRFELVRASDSLWDTRLRSAAARLQLDDAAHMGRSLDRFTHDVGIVTRYRRELGFRQVDILGKGEFMPLSALREQRALATLIAQMEDETPHLDLVADVIPIMQQFIAETRQGYRDALAQLEPRAAADQAPYRAARIKRLARLRPNPQAPAAVCETLRRHIAEAAPLQSEQSFEEFVSTCVAHF